MADKGIKQGTPLDEVTERLVCDICGAALAEDQIKCPRCGMVVEEMDEVEESLLHWGDEIVYPEDVCDL